MDDDNQLYDVNEFWRFDMRVGEVIEAEKIQRTKKLIKLTVDFGNHMRVIIAGIGDQYTPEDLRGKKMIFVINLKPKKLSGVVSEGMMIVAEEKDGKVHLITLSDDVPNGTKVW